MKVLHIIDGLESNGAEITLYRLLSAIDQKRFDSAVVSLRDGGTLGGHIEALGIPVYTLGMENIFCSGRSFWRLVRVIRAVQPDIIQGWMYYGSISATIGAALTPGSRSVIWNIHHTVDHLEHEKRIIQMVIRLGALLSSSPAHIIYCAWAAAKCHEAMGYDANEPSVIPNGFDLTKFVPSRLARISVRSELGINDRTLLVGLVARFHPMKDHTTFLAAAAILAAKRPDIHFLMAGPGMEADNDSIKRLVASHGLLPRVHILGERRDVPRLMAALDIICCSSAWGEAFPNVIGEAMACGVPCVTTDVGDAAWMVGQTGRVVPPREPESLAGACQEIFTLDPEERSLLGTMARDRVQELFSLRKMVDAYQEVYEVVASSNKS